MDAKLNLNAFVAPLQPAASAGSPAFDRTAKLFTSAAGWLRRWAASARGVHSRSAADELRAMSEHELRDLGIGRSEIPHILGRAACHPLTEQQPVRESVR